MLELHFAHLGGGGVFTIAGGGQGFGVGGATKRVLACMRHAAAFPPAAPEGFATVAEHNPALRAKPRAGAATAALQFTRMLVK